MLPIYSATDKIINTSFSYLCTYYCSFSSSSSRMMMKTYLVQMMI